MDRALDGLDRVPGHVIPLRILNVCAEFVPLAKSGGLGDVTAALARSLTGAGHDVVTASASLDRIVSGQTDDVVPALTALEGVVMELMDGAFPLLQSIEITDDANRNGSTPI